MITLYESDTHKNVFFNDLSEGHMIQANQHIIVDNKEGILMDPGGHKVHTKLFAALGPVLPISGLKHIFFSHQDPDIVAAMNAWLMLTDATGHLSGLWSRFVTHFGIDKLVVDRLIEIPDTGKTLMLGKNPLKFVPAHFLHSCGNFHLYDPVSKILYTGDLGASIGQDYAVVEDFEGHIRYMKGFHQRYMPSNKVLRMWAEMARTMDIEIIAPQHGAFFPNKEMCNQFIDWIETIDSGIDLMEGVFQVPA